MLTVVSIDYNTDNTYNMYYRENFPRGIFQKTDLQVKGAGASHLFGPHLILGLEARVGRGSGSTKLLGNSCYLFAFPQHLPAKGDPKERLGKAPQKIGKIGSA